MSRKGVIRPVSDDHFARKRERASAQAAVTREKIGRGNLFSLFHI